MKIQMLLAACLAALCCQYADAQKPAAIEWLVLPEASATAPQNDWMVLPDLKAPSEDAAINTALRSVHSYQAAYEASEKDGRSIVVCVGQSVESMRRQHERCRREGLHFAVESTSEWSRISEGRGPGVWTFPAGRASTASITRSTIALVTHATPVQSCENGECSIACENGRCDIVHGAPYCSSCSRR